jgi:A/G-specific adenine glycosylase
MGTREHMNRSTEVDTPTRRAFQVALMRWYRRNKRDLPWRRTRDPYKVWVSEVMLQQTRVDVVTDYYRRWMRAFPSVRTLARAPLTRALKLWEGLGYYARARNLHRGAQYVMETFGGQLPRTVDGLMEIPGIGRYTAGAVASIAFDEPVSLVDGNVARVLARVFAIRDNVKQPATLKRLYGLADALVPATRPGDFNQALMELGALVCLPQQPRCGCCPLRSCCLATARGLTDTLPNRGTARRTIHLVRDVVRVMRGGRLLLRQRPGDGQLAGMWELPSVDDAPFDVGAPLAELRHTITHHRILLRAFEATVASDIGRTDERWRWVTPVEARRLSLPAAHRKLVNRIGFTGSMPDVSAS